MKELALIFFSLFVGYSAGKNRERNKCEKEILKLQIENEILKNPDLSDEEAATKLEYLKKQNSFVMRIWNWIRM